MSEIEFDLPHILEIPASELCLETDDHAKDKEELSHYINNYLDNEYDYCYKGYKIMQVKWNENKKFSSVVIEIEWDVSE